MFYIYLNSFPYLKLGYGAALSLILAAIILVFTVVQMMLTPPERRDDRSRGPARGLPRSAPCCVGDAAWCMVTPIVLSVLASVKTTAEAAAIPPTYFPHGLSLDSYRRCGRTRPGCRRICSTASATAF